MKNENLRQPQGECQTMRGEESTRIRAQDTANGGKERDRRSETIRDERLHFGFFCTWTGILLGRAHGRVRARPLPKVSFVFLAND